MLTTVINFLANIITQVIGFTGYSGVFILMFLESCGIPIPSEIIMPFSGFLVAVGKMGFWFVVLAGAVGNLGGSLLAYFIGARGGRPLIEKYGKYILISKHDLNLADKWFSRHGDLTVFGGRLLPIIRTYISFPAGISKMNVFKFSFYTFIGALPWCALFTWLGVKLQNHWESIHTNFRGLEYLVLALIIILIILYVWRHIRNSRRELN